jgi:hypothetical protein
MPCENLRVV